MIPRFSKTYSFSSYEHSNSKIIVSERKKIRKEQAIFRDFFHKYFYFHQYYFIQKYK